MNKQYSAVVKINQHMLNVQNDTSIRLRNLTLRKLHIKFIIITYNYHKYLFNSEYSPFTNIISVFGPKMLL